MTGLGFPVIEQANDDTNLTAVCAAVVDIVGGFCPCDIGLTLSRTDATHMRLTFSAPVELNPYLSAPVNWRIYDQAGVAPDLIIYSIAPEAVAEPTYIDFTTSEQRTGVNYVAHAYILEIA
jgi:hypothetical protein